MPFNQIQKSIFVVVIALFMSCEEGGENPLSYSTDVVTKDQLNELAGKINFEVTMADGNSVILSSSQSFSSYKEDNFSEMSDWHYTNAETVLVELESVETGDLGYINIYNSSSNLIDEATFGYTYCSSYRDVRLKYPELGLSSDTDEYELIVALGQPGQDIVDVFSGQTTIYVDYLVVVISPQGLIHHHEFISTDFDYYYLLGENFSRNGSVVESNGSVYGSDLFYEYEINCY